MLGHLVEPDRPQPKPPDDHTTKQAASHGHRSPLTPGFQTAGTDFPEEGQHQPRVLVISIKYYL